MNGAELFVRELKTRGVSYIATLCGHGQDPLYEACKKFDLQLVDVRNEQAASYIAEVTGRLTRQPGVCAVSSGVAHANALTGVVDAHFDGAPMLLVTGCGPSETIGLGHFQDFPQVAMAEPVCKYAKIIDCPERIPNYIHEAFAAATAPRQGPVHLTFPLDVQSADVDLNAVIQVYDSSPTRSLGDPDLIDEAANLISASKRPLLIAGSGLFYSGGEEALRDLAVGLSIPVVIPTWDRGSVLQPMDPFMGVIGAATGGPRLLADADLILMIGARCDYRVGYLQPPEVREDARIVRIEADPAQIDQGAGAHVRILGDPKSVLIQIGDACTSLGVSSKTDWLKEAKTRQEAFRKNCKSVAQNKEGKLHALDILRAVQSLLTDETILIIDGGNIGQWAHQILCSERYPGHWISNGAAGVVGFGLPAAMAARLVYPKRPVVLITGDGALTFTVAEFETAARQGMNFVVLLADDEAWGITLTGHQRTFGQGISSELGPIRFDKMAEAFGCRGLRVEKADQISPAIEEGLTSSCPTLIHIPVVRSNPSDVIDK